MSVIHHHSTSKMYPPLHSIWGTTLLHQPHKICKDKLLKILNTCNFSIFGVSETKLIYVSFHKKMWTLCHRKYCVLFLYKWQLKQVFLLILNKNINLSDQKIKIWVNRFAGSRFKDPYVLSVPNEMISSNVNVTQHVYSTVY